MGEAPNKIGLQMPPSEKPQSVNSEQWAALAEQAQSCLVGARHGERGKIYTDLGHEFGLDANVVRRAIAALSSLKDIEAVNSALASRLRTAPLQVAEVIARWLKHSPKDALDAAQSYLDGKFSTRALAEAEREGRPKRDAHSMTGPEWRKLAVFGALIWLSHPNDGELLDVQYHSNPWRATFEFGRSHASYVLFAPGPYQNRQHYEEKKSYIIYRSTDFVADYIIIALPDVGLVNSYYTFWKSRGIDRDFIFIAPRDDQSLPYALE